MGVLGFWEKEDQKGNPTKNGMQYPVFLERLGTTSTSGGEGQGRKREGQGGWLWGGGGGFGLEGKKKTPGKQNTNVNMDPAAYSVLLL